MRPPLPPLPASSPGPRVDLAKLAEETRYLIIYHTLPPISTFLLPSFSFAPPAEYYRTAYCSEKEGDGDGDVGCQGW